MKKAWIIFIAIYLASVVPVINQFKVAPVMGVLIQQFRISNATAGLLMSVFALTGIILAFPAADILRRFGSRNSGLIGLGCTILGCIVGALAPNVPLLMIGRVIEGMGVTLIGVIAPATIAICFGRDKSGLPMGIWATWFPVGSTIAYNISHPVKATFGGGWQSNWWFGAFLALVVFIIYGLIVNVSNENEQSHGGGHPSVPFSAGLKNIKIWLLCFSFFCLAGTSTAFSTWAPYYFSSVFGLNEATANFYASIKYLFSAPGGIVAALVLSKVIHQRHYLLIACAVLSLIIFPFAFLIPQSLILYYSAMIGFIVGFACSTTFAMIPTVMSEPALIGLGMGVMSVMQGLANVLSTPLLGLVIGKNYHWGRAAVPMACVLIMGLISIFFFAKFENNRLTTVKVKVNRKYPVNPSDVETSGTM